MATTRLAFGSVLGTVADTANTISDLVKTTGLGIGMVNKFVSEASVDQRERAVAHRATFRNSLIKEASMEIARSGKEVVDFMAESADNSALYLDAEATLKAAFAAFDGPVK